MRFRYLEYLGWPSDIAWHGFRKGISDCATQSLSDMPFRLIWEIIQNPFCLRSVMQWPQHQSFGTLSTFLQVLDSSGFCCHCVLNRTSFRILKTGSCQAAVPDVDQCRENCRQQWAGELRENLIKGWFSILQLVNMSEKQYVDCCDCDWWTCKEEYGTRLHLHYLPCQATDGKPWPWFGTQSDSKAQGHKALNPWLLKPEIKSTYNKTFLGDVHTYVGVILI